VSAVIPELAVRGGRDAIEFYRRAFGAVEVYRVGGSDEHEAVVAELRIGEAAFWVHDESPEHGTFSPQTLGGATTRLLLVVEDPDATMASALAAGARAVRPLVEEHRWRLGCVEDPYGHHWEIGRPLVAWPPR
jgi:PhnB protein